MATYLSPGKGNFSLCNPSQRAKDKLPWGPEGLVDQAKRQPGLFLRADSSNSLLLVFWVFSSGASWTPGLTLPIDHPVHLNRYLLLYTWFVYKKQTQKKYFKCANL
jgi:hypothetical protein